jgi:hypothetical protein
MMSLQNKEGQGSTHEEGIANNPARGIAPSTERKERTEALRLGELCQLEITVADRPMAASKR